MNHTDFKHTSDFRCVTVLYLPHSFVCFAFLRLFISSPVVETASHSQRQASSYSQLNMFGGFNRGFTRSNGVYVPTSSVFSEVSCISSLSLSCAQPSHPYWYLVDSVSWSFQARWGWRSCAAAISEFLKGVVTLPDLEWSFTVGLRDYLYDFVQFKFAQIPNELTYVLVMSGRMHM